MRNQLLWIIGVIIVLLGAVELVANSSPQLALPGPQTVAEGDSLVFTVSATDPDGDSIILFAENLPYEAVFTDNGDGTGTFAWIPGYCQAGNYEVTFIAKDVADTPLTDTGYVLITVTQSNRTPVIETITDTSIVEGDTLEFEISAHDPDTCDGDLVYISCCNLPDGAHIVSDTANPVSAAFMWNPDYTQAGVYNVVFVALDTREPPGAESTVVQITVEESGNHPPVINPIGDFEVYEGETLTFEVTASDPDGDSLALWYHPITPGVTFIDHGDGTGTFIFAPDYYAAGVDTFSFFASDTGEPPYTVQEISVVTVIDVNQPPVIDSIGPQKIEEGQLLKLKIKASDPTDPDGGPLYLSAINLPENATFVDNGDGTADFVFKPDYTQAGYYEVTFICADADTPQLSDEEVVPITVIDVNCPPQFDTVDYYLITEGDTLIDTLRAHDLDGDSIYMWVDSLPENAIFQDLGDGRGILYFESQYWQAGIYTLVFHASDGKATSHMAVPLQIEEAGNHAPVIDSVRGDFDVLEGETLQLGVWASDIDRDSIVLICENIPENAHFNDHGDGTGLFVFYPNYTQSGSYELRFIAADTSLADTEIVTVTIIEVGDHPPEIVVPDTQFVDENDTLSFAVTATDPEGDSIFFTVDSLPSNASYVDHGDGTIEFIFTPSFEQAGIYNVYFIATDDSLLSDTGVVTIVVNNVNRAPVIDSIPDYDINEGDTLQFIVHAIDPDGDSVWMWLYPVIWSVDFVDNGDGTAEFFYAPDYNGAGVHGFWVYASDGDLMDTVFFRVIVHNTNRPPILDSIGPKSVVEGETLTFNVTAFDPDGTPLILSASPLPENAAFEDLGNDTGVFVFTPSYTQSGVYHVLFKASDGDLADSELVEITVIEAGNQRPYLDSLPPQVIYEWDTLTVEIVAHDPDEVPPHLFAESLPENSQFVDNGDGTGIFTFYPNCSQAGVYSVIFIAVDQDDSTFQDTVILEITVNDYNHPPLLEVYPESLSVSYGDTAEFTLIAHDLEVQAGCDSVVFNVIDGLEGEITSLDESTAVFRWINDGAHIGTYEITFEADDGNGGKDTVTVSFNAEGLVVAKPVCLDEDKEGLHLSVVLMPEGNGYRVGLIVKNNTDWLRVVRVKDVYYQNNRSYFNVSYRKFTDKFEFGIQQIWGLLPGETTPILWTSEPINRADFFGFKVELEYRDDTLGWRELTYCLDYTCYSVHRGDDIEIVLPVTVSSMTYAIVEVAAPDSWNFNAIPDSFMVIPGDTAFVHITANVPHDGNQGALVFILLKDNFHDDTLKIVREFLVNGFSCAAISSQGVYRRKEIGVTGNISISGSGLLEFDNSVVNLTTAPTHHVEVGCGGQLDLTGSILCDLSTRFSFEAYGEITCKTALLRNYSSVETEPEALEFENVTLENVSGTVLAISAMPEQFELRNVFVRDCEGYGLVLEDFPPCTLYNIVFTDFTGQELVLHSSDVTVVDGNLDTASIEIDATSRFKQAYSFYLNVLDRDSTFLEGVEVEITDRNGDVVYDTLTGGSLTLGPILLPRFAIDDSGAEEFAPYTLRLTYMGVDSILPLDINGPTLMTVIFTGRAFVRGDANADGHVDISDAAYILSNLMPWPDFPCSDAADADDDGALTVIDASFAINHLLPSPSFPPPNNVCGFDPTFDSLTCDNFAPCGGRVAEMLSSTGVCSLWVDVRLDRNGLLLLDVFMFNSVPVAGFQFTVDYDCSSLEPLEIRYVDNQWENVDAAISAVDSSGGKFCFATLYSLVPGEFIKGRRYWKPGKHYLLTLPFVMKTENAVVPHVEEVIFSDIYGYPMRYKPERALSAGVLSDKETEGAIRVLSKPNPFSKELEIQLTVPSEAWVAIDIYNSSGRRVAELVNRRFPEGIYTFKWDGRSDSGKILPDGVYFYHVRFNGKVKFVERVLKMD